MDIEQPADPQRPVGRPLAECNQREVLADAHLVGGIDEVVREPVDADRGVTLSFVHCDRPSRQLRVEQAYRRRPRRANSPRFRSGARRDAAP